MDRNGRQVRVIAINDAYRLAPWADVLYFCDDKWWGWHAQKLAGWQGLIVRVEGGKHDFSDPRIKVMRNVDRPAGPRERVERKGGLSDQRDGLRTGKNSGYQAINLAVHLGGILIALLGYDLDAPLVNRRPRTHWFGDHPGGTSPKVYDEMLPWFDTLPKPLAERGVEVVNCTGGGRLRAFPRKSLQEVLPDPATAPQPVLAAAQAAA
jgi:hypothetical protein